MKPPSPDPRIRRLLSLRARRRGFRLGAVLDTASAAARSVCRSPGLAAGVVLAFALGASLFTAFGLLALVVAGIGLYSVLAFDVAQRVREIGLRTALGATRLRLVGLVLSRALLTTAAGVVVGLLIAFVLAPRLQPLRFDTSGRDPLTLAAVAAVLMVVAGLAGGYPAWRAARIDPANALRTE